MTIILLCGLVWFYAYKCYICLTISAHALPRMINDFNFVCSTRIYVNVLHWIVGLHYYNFLVNEGYIHSIHLLLLYYIIRTSTQPLLLYDPLRFLLIYLNHIRLHKHYHIIHILYTFLLYWLKLIHIDVYYYYYHTLGALNISFY